MKCKNCTRLYKAYDEESEVENGLWCDKIFDSPDVEMERDCIHYKCMTNGDRLRAMSNEELVEWIFKHDTYVVCHGRKRRDELLEWLEKEANG